MKIFWIFIFLFIFSFTLSSQDKLKVGIVLYNSEEKIKSTYMPLIQYVAKRVGMKAEVNILEEDDLAYYLNNGEYDVGIFTVFSYLKIKTDYPDLKVFSTHQIDGKDHFYGTILVNNNSNINTLQDIKGKKFMFVKRTSTSGFKYPKGILNENNIDIETMLEYDFAGEHERAIMLLKAGKVDVIAVNEGKIKNIRGVEESDFREIEKYKVPYHAYVLSSKMTEDLKDKLKNIFQDSHKDPLIRHLWNNPLGIEKWLLKKDEYYNPIRRYLRIVRVKPEVNINITSTEKARIKLSKLGDITTILEKKIRRHFTESKRFSNDISHNAEYDLNIKLSVMGQKYSYQIQINDEYVMDGEMDIDSMSTIVPLMTLRALLKKGEIKTNLLYNGSDWFITYGLNDGINIQDYEFELTQENGKKIVVNPEDIKSINEFNISFKNSSNFYKNAPIVIRFIEEINENNANIRSSENVDNIQNIGTYNIFSRNFWQEHYWDKLGLAIGLIMALISAIIGKMIANRKKKRFKDILHKTNDLIGEVIRDHYKMEIKLIEQKENVSAALENGHINENQFLILNQRIDDMQNMIEVRSQGEVKISDEEVAEISNIMKDDKVTERDFTRIMNIYEKEKKRYQNQNKLLFNCRIF